jgi:GT2 family glycosyltransferase/glycosyltransferase involved in cell wall biosynthesis
VNDAFGAVEFRPPADPLVSIIIATMGQPARLLSCLRSVAESTHDVDYEVVLVLNGVDELDRSAIARYVRGARTITSRVNRGFAAASNLGAAAGRGPFVALLNDDTLVERGWLGALVEAVDGHPRAAAVGSRLLHLDGSLQEAGQVLWADGSTSCVGRGAPESAHAFEWARRVDYCSASSLLVRRSTWEHLGGLDEAFFPAYCEDVDFCLRIAATGGEVWYEPRSRVRHLESSSSSPRYKEFLITRNRALLVDRWTDDVLVRRLPPAPDDAEAVGRSIRRAMGDPLEVLVIDDRVPAPSLGAGFPRMFDALVELAAIGHHVTLLPTHTRDGDGTAFALAGIDVVRQPPEAYFARPEAACHVAVISRPNNFEQWSGPVRRRFPSAPIIYDTEALFHRRMEVRLELLEGPERDLEQSLAAIMARTERTIFSSCDHIVCLSEDEAAIVRSTPGAAEVTVKVPLLQGIDASRAPFEERGDLVLLASWVAGSGSPNVDGLQWFLREVFPRIRSRIPWTRLLVSGENPPSSIVEAAGPGVVLLGHVADLTSLYDRARAVVVPLRFGSGVKSKTIEALQYQVPTVATTIGAEGINLYGTKALSITDDSSEFADAAVALLEDRDAWNLRRRELAELTRRWDEMEVRRPSWGDVVATVLARSPGGRWPTGARSRGA